MKTKTLIALLELSGISILLTGETDLLKILNIIIFCVIFFFFMKTISGKRIIVKLNKIIK